MESLLASASQVPIQDVGVWIGIEDQVEWIERELRLMQSSLEHVEANRQPADDEIKWASEARDVIQEVENIIDVFLRKTAQYRRRGTFRRLVFVFNHLIVRLKLYLKVEKIKFQIWDVSKRRPKQPQESYSYPDRSSSSQAGPSTSDEPQITREAATSAVASVIGQVDFVMSQNLLVHMGVIKIVRDIGDEFKRLHGMLNDFKLEKKLDERTRSWMEDVRDTSKLTGPIFASFIDIREQHLTHQRTFQFRFLFLGDLSFGKKLMWVRFQIHDLYRRNWTYGIGDLSEIPMSMASNITMRLFSPTVEANETFPFLSSFGHSRERMASLFKVKESVGLRRPVNDQLESIKRDLRLMQGLFKDVGGMEDTGKRVKVWLDEMQDIERDIVKFLRQAEQENVTTTLWKPRSVFREWKTRQQIARKIECINDELWGISNRKWTYDIGKIEGRRSSEVEDQSEQEVESSTPTAVSYHESQEGVELLVLADFPLLKQHSDESRERVESLRRELKLMCALCDDANSMDEKNARLKVWTKQMQEVYEDARKFIDSYDRKIEQKGVGVSRIYRFLRFVAPREIDRIQNHICELSRRKWTYDIGGIQPRKGQSYVGKPSTREARCMLISEPEAHCLSRSESAQPLSSHQIGRRNAFTRLFASVSMALDAVLPEPQLANSVEQLEENVKSIKEERSLMHSLLEDIGDLERCDGRRAWVKDMEDVSFAVDAAVAAYEEATKPNIWCLGNRVWIAKKIEDIMHKIQVLSDRRRVYGIEFGKTRKAHNVLNMAGNPHQRPPPSVHIKRRDIASFYDDLQAVVALLLTNNENRSIISIVGMEGIGKSTLVELLYENMAVRQHFTCNAWVSVHSDCKVEGLEALMRSIEEQVLVSLQENKRKPIGLRKQDGKLAAEEAPVLTLSAILEVNRYLIVLDDVSTTEIWDRLIKEFPSTLHGSRIVLTTHDVDVATHADPKSVHRLRLLSDDDSWALFTKTLTVPNGLLERSRKMVMRCGGLPRAILQLREQFAGTESTSGAWLRVLENPEFDQQPWKKTLDMMNSGLPLNLKRSLFYLGRFPVDFDISLRRLIVLWIAEGLVHQKRGDEEPPETVAERYLAELIDRNMVQVTKNKLNGAVKNCRLPYALREICPLSEPKKAEYPKSHTTKNSKLSPTSRKVHHLTHHSNGDDVSFHHILGDTTNLSPDSLLPGYKHAISFRSFDTREGSQPGKDLGKFLEHCISSWYFLSLRVLDLERVFRPELPKALGKLVLLRYLGLRWTYLDSLPSFIHKLLNLQTLDLKHTSINSLPTSIWKMEQLRHLYLDEDYRCRFVPRPSGYSLTDLQTLWSVFIDEDSPVKDGLDGLINLKRLGVMSRLMSSRQEAMLSQLEAVANWVQKLELLQSLRLKSFDKQGKPWQLPKLDLTGLTNLSCLYLLGRIAESNLASVLSSALTELSLSGSGLTEDPMPKLGELQHLRILRLLSESFVGKHMRCPSRGFPQLRILKLWKLEQLEEWTVENGALSDLIELEIRYCQNLKKLPNELRHSRTLQILLEYSNMPGGKYNFAETFNILRSQVREKLEKATISKSKKTFLWKIASDELPIGSRECPFCGAEPESAVHLFFLCKPVRMVWFAKWGLRTDTDTLSNISIAEWINNLLTPSLIFGDSPPNEMDFLHFAVIFIEKIWLWRNEVAPDHVAVDPTQFMEKLALLFLKE